MRRFLSLEWSIRSKGKFKIVNEVMQEYFELGHAELVLLADFNKPPSQVFYLPVHTVEKESMQPQRSVLFLMLQLKHFMFLSMTHYWLDQLSTLP